MQRVVTLVRRLHATMAMYETALQRAGFGVGPNGASAASACHISERPTKALQRLHPVAGMILAARMCCARRQRMLTILLVAAVVCFFLAAFGIPSSKVNLVALGLALWALAVTIEKMVI